MIGKDSSNDDDTAPIDDTSHVADDGGNARPAIDPAKAAMLMEQFAREQNLMAGVAASFGVAVVGAAVWALITVVTNYQIGWMAVGLGVGVGFAMRKVGKGLTSQFSVAGGAIALFGCLLGNIFTVVYFVADGEGMAFVEVLAQLTPALVVDLLVETFSPMDLLFYGFAVYEGYKLSIRTVTDDDLADLADRQMRAPSTY